MRVAFFGGSFNPPHVAHVLAAVYALSVGGFDRVLVVPVFDHAFDKKLVPFAHRARLCELALAWINDVEVSRVEQELPTPSLTLRTVEHLAAKHPNWQIRLMIGADTLAESHKWHRFDKIAEISPPFVLGRIGFSHPAAPLPILPDVSSTRIRKLLVQRGKPEADDEIARTVPTRVLEYIDAHGLYSA
jgi:nicotinate-nucleotide adenylyltransferase